MPLFVLKERYERIVVPFHAHRRAQLIHVSRGTLTVATQNHQWTIPPQRGVWIAPGTEHRIVSATPFTLTTCYVEPQHFGMRQQGIVAVDALTHALLPEVAGLGPDWKTPEARRLVAVLFDRLDALPDPRTGLPISSGEPLARLARLLLNDPSIQDPLSILAPRARSKRTHLLHRHFLSEFGMSFGAWRRQLRLRDSARPAWVQVSRSPRRHSMSDTKMYLRSSQRSAPNLETHRARCLEINLRGLKPWFLERHTRSSPQFNNNRFWKGVRNQ